MDDYIRDGFLRAMAEVRRITGEKQINAVGYCIAGTTLGLTLAHLQKAGDTSVKSATFFTTLTDFSDPGEVGVFLNDDFVDGIERQTAQDGILSQGLHEPDLQLPALQRPDLQPAIKQLHAGRGAARLRPALLERRRHQPAREDGGRIPARALPAATDLPRASSRSSATRSAWPTSSCRSAPSPARPTTSPHWKGSFNGIKQMGSKDKTFILSQSGHIAGIINPPSKGKYGHYTNDAPDAGDAGGLAKRAPPSTRAAGGRAGASGWRRGPGRMIKARPR